MTKEICAIKIRHRTSAEAKRATLYVKMRKGTKLYTYKCKLCRGYHVTKSSGELP